MKVFKNIPVTINALSEKIAQQTSCFVESGFGKIFLSLVLVGPFTFLPTLYQAWTAPNIEALRTPTWPMMTVVNSAALLGVIHKGDWRMRLVMVIWVIIMILTWLATVIR